jgi:regulator of RNase E activity RraA
MSLPHPALDQLSISTTKEQFLMHDPITRLRALYTPVVSDALDSLGLRERTLDPAIVRVAGPTNAAGRATTMQVIAVDSPPAEPYKVQFEAIDAVQEGQMMMVSAPDVRSAFWGELLTTGARTRGSSAAIVDGYCRDIEKVRAQDFGVWARGTHPADSLGRLDAISRDVPISCGGVRVVPGDYVLADSDGVVVVPAALIDEVLQLAERKMAAEDEVRARLLSGSSVMHTYLETGVM